LETLVVQQGLFTILPPAESASIRESLAALEPATLPGYPKNTVSLMRAGLLFEQELYAEARQELLAAIAADPDEPSLHLLLGHGADRPQGTCRRGIRRGRFPVDANAVKTDLG
jgi:hypothetical protein